MQLLHHRSGPAVTSHVDLSDDCVNSDHMFYDIARAVYDGAVHLHEARVALALLLEELKGFRHIEQASGLTDDSLLKILPQAGCSTTLLTCSNRGKFALDEESRHHIVLGLRRYRPQAGHLSSSTSQNPYDQEKVVKDLDPLKDLNVENLGGVRQVSKEDLPLLAPSLDIWSNTSQSGAGDGYLGDAGWALALVTGLKPTRFTMGEIARITHVGERQARRIVDRLVEQRWAKRVREGRRVFVIVDFSLMGHEDFRQDSLRAKRRAHKSEIQKHEDRALKYVGTKVGRMARDLWMSGKKKITGRKRPDDLPSIETEIRMLEEWESMPGNRGCFRELIDILKRGRLEDHPRGLNRFEALSRICAFMTSGHSQTH